MRPSLTRARPRRRRTRLVAIGLAAASALGMTVLAEPAQATVYNVPNCGSYDMDDSFAFIYFLAGAASSPVGCPTSNTRTVPSGAGIFNHFQNGSLYWKNTDPNATIHGVLEPIRAKWKSLSWERGLLGWPTSDTFNGTSLAGEPSTGQHFEGGRIYQSPGTGAHEIHGSILAKYNADNLFPQLGLPITDELDFADGGKVSHFEKGSIYWWSDTGAIPILGKEIRVSFRGVHAFERTDDGIDFDGDEVYATVGASWPGGRKDAQIRNFNGLYTGDSGIDNYPLYRGSPKGIVINTLLMEHDSGDKNKYRDAVQKGVEAGAKELSKLLAEVPYVGWVLAIASVPAFNAVIPSITKVVNDLLGTGDDKIGENTVMFSAKDMVVLAAAPTRTEGEGIVFKHRTPAMKGTDSNYRAYFDVGVR